MRQTQPFSFVHFAVWHAEIPQMPLATCNAYARGKRAMRICGASFIFEDWPANSSVACDAALLE